MSWCAWRCDALQEFEACLVADVLGVFLELFTPLRDGKRSCVVVQYFVGLALVSNSLPVRCRCRHLAEKVPGSQSPLRP